MRLQREENSVSPTQPEPYTLSRLNNEVPLFDLRCISTAATTTRSGEITHPHNTIRHTLPTTVPGAAQRRRPAWRRRGRTCGAGQVPGVFHASSRTGTPSSHPKADCTDSSATSRTSRLARIKPYSAISQNLAMSGLPARVHLRCHTCRLRRDAHIRIRDDEAAWWGSTLQTVSALLWWASAIGGVFAWTVLLAKLQHRPFARARPAQPPAPWHPPPPYPPTEYPQQPPQP